MPTRRRIADCSYGDLSTSPEARLVKKRVSINCLALHLLRHWDAVYVEAEKPRAALGLWQREKVSRTTKLHDWTDNELTLSIAKQILKSGQPLVMAP